MNELDKLVFVRTKKGVKIYGLSIDLFWKLGWGLIGIIKYKHHLDSYYFSLGWNVLSISESYFEQINRKIKELRKLRSQKVNRWFGKK